MANRLVTLVRLSLGLFLAASALQVSARASVAPDERVVHYVVVRKGPGTTTPAPGDLALGICGSSRLPNTTLAYLPRWSDKARPLSGATFIPDFFETSAVPQVTKTSVKILGANPR